MRKENDSFSVGSLQVFQTGTEHVLGFTRPGMVILANFSEGHQTISYPLLEKRIGDEFKRIHGISEIFKEKDLRLEPLDFLVIKHQVRFEA
jgi:hypothetical protein